MKCEVGIIQSLPSITLYTENWCILPYPRHPKGCPNFKHKKGCPPNAKSIKDLIQPPFFIIGVRFNLAEHVFRMKKKHPHLSYAQARCVLYWQNKVNKRLREDVEFFLSDQTQNFVAVFNPEANGVDMFETLKTIGLQLVRNPQCYVWKLAIVGIQK